MNTTLLKTFFFYLDFSEINNYVCINVRWVNYIFIYSRHMKCDIKIYLLNRIFTEVGKRLQCTLQFAHVVVTFRSHYELYQPSVQSRASN